jgi:hypothetical protein
MIGGGAGRLAGTVLDGGYFADFNVVVGAQAYSGDSVAPRPAGGRYNFALGYRAMGLGAIGTGNSAIGTQTLLNLATGSNNTAIGYDSGNGLLIGSSNVFIGYRTAGNTKYGNGLIAIGDAAAYSLYNNVASSGVSVNSIAIGSNALYGRTTNTSISNIAIGGSALNEHGWGDGNVALGVSAIQRNVSASYNIAIGYQALQDNTSVPLPNVIVDNIAIGRLAGRNLTGSNNVVIGTEALRGSGTSVDDLGANSPWNFQNNVAIGYQAGRYASSNTANSVFIGPNAGPASATQINNKLYIANAAGNPLIGGDFSAKTVTISASLYISGSIIPNVDASMTSSFELGSPTAAWNRIWVRSSSIHFVDDNGDELAKISATPSGQISLPNIYTDGTFTAQTFVTQSTTTIIEIFHATGSNQFGSSSLDTHQFTGSVYISGGLEQTSGNVTLRNTIVNGNLTATGSVYLTSLLNTSQTNVLTYDVGSGQIYYTASTALAPSINVGSFATTGSNVIAGSQNIYDDTNALSIRSTSTTRKLYDTAGQSSIDWSARTLIDNQGFNAFDFQNRQLFDELEVPVLQLVNNSATFNQDVILSGVTQDSSNVTSTTVVMDNTTKKLYVTASDAVGRLPFPYNGNAVITGSLTLGSEQAPALYNTTKSLVDTGTNTIYSVSTASYDSMFLDYTIKSGSNMRAGQMTATWLEGSVVYNEIATVDIGNTVGTIFEAALSDSTASINFTATSDGWTVKTIIRSI